MPILDSIIGALAPGWALRRELARRQLEELQKAYRGAQHQRHDRPPSTLIGAGADWTLESQYDRRWLLNRGRQLERDSALGDTMLSASCLNVVGCGFRLQAQSPDDGWNREVEMAWKEWSEDGADSRGLCTLNELLSLVYRSYLRDGDVGIVKQPDFTLRVVEADEIVSPDGPFRPNRGVDGIDLDKNGRPVQFHILTDPRSPYGNRTASAQTTKVPADRMLFLARRQRIGQTRGVSAFSTVSWILDQVDGQIEAVTVAARMAAMFGLVLKRTGRFDATALGSTTTDGESKTRKKLHLEPGAFLELDPDEDIEQVTPTHPKTNFEGFIRLLARFVARPFGLPLEVALLDFSQSNFSSSRGALLQSWQTWQEAQAMLARLMSRIYYWRLADWMKSRKIRPIDDWDKHCWQKPGWKWIDPEKEAKANMALVDGGFATITDILAQHGVDRDEMWETRKRELEDAEKLGIPLSRSTLTRDEMPTEPTAPPSSRPR